MYVCNIIFVRQSEDEPYGILYIIYVSRWDFGLGKQPLDRLPSKTTRAKALAGEGHHDMRESETAVYDGK